MTRLQPDTIQGRAASRLTARLLIAVCLVCLAGAAESARAQLSVTPITWHVIGLDSNNVNVGPNRYQVGARACNTSASTLNNLVATFNWDSANAFINLAGPSVITTNRLSAGRCVDYYFLVTVTRNAGAYNATRRFRISVSADGVPAVSTPSPRELYVERIISQSRNTVNSITGPTTVYVGETYQYTLRASTATQGYEQLEAFLDLSNVIFQVQSVQTTYSAPAGGTNDKVYADACGWDPVPGSPTYRSCIGPVNYPGGKAGGTIVSTYTVKILSTGTTSVGAIILDFSGSSYHYNNDYGGTAISITAVEPPVTLAKTSNVTQVTTAGATVTYTLRVTNTGTGSYTLTDFIDTPPSSPAAPTYVAGSSIFNGAAIPNPTVSGSSLIWSGSFLIPAGSTRDLAYQMTIPNTPGTYTNSAIARGDFVQIDTTPPISDNAPATRSVTRPPPDLALVKSVNPTTTVLPGADLNYTIAFTNGGGAPASNVIIADPIPADTDFKVGSAAASLGATGLTVAIEYSNDGGTTWTYTPASGGGGAPAGYDRSVTHVRWVLTGSLATSSSGSVSFTVRVR